MSGGLVYAAAGYDGIVILQTYTPQPNDTLHFSANPGVRGDIFRCAIGGLPGIRVGVERSSDLLHWENWMDLILPSTPLDLERPIEPTEPAQFFRATIR